MKRVAVFGSILFATFVLATGLYFYRLFSEEKRERLFATPLHTIAQTGPEKRALKTDYLFELIKQLSLKQAQKALLKSPLIKKASVKPLSPGKLWVDYTIRKPYVWLADYENLVLDREGYPLPFSPFYTPKNMPRLFLGVKDVEWNQPLKGELVSSAFEIFGFLEGVTDFFSIEILDVSHLNHSSLGRREIVLILSKDNRRHYLRLNPQSYREQWKRYCLLEPKLEEGNKVIDLRLSKLAYIKGIQ